MNRYIFVVDEKGDPGLALGASKNLVIGGFVVAQNKLPKVESTWRDFKEKTCGTSEVELKSEHFFASRSKNNPLLFKSRKKRRKLAMEGFEQIYDHSSVAPLACCIFKERASNALIVPTGGNRKRIDDNTIWVAPFGLFAVFVSNKRATGQVWWDEVSGVQEAEKKNMEWQNLKRMSGRPKLMNIDDEILFLNSHENDAIQIADLLCGVLWQAMKGDEIYLARFLEKYDAKSRGDGLGILILE